jgi:hypothetical protein
MQTSQKTTSRKLSYGVDRQTDRQTGRDTQTSQNFGSIGRATEEERSTGKGNSHETSKACATISKIGILRDERDDDAGPRARGRPATTTTTTTEDGTRGRARVCGKEPKKTHPEKAK